MNKNFCSFLVILLFSRVRSYYLEGEYPWCKPTSETLDYDKSCMLDADEKQNTLKKIFEIICFDNLNNLMESNLKEDSFDIFFIRK